MFDQLRNDPGLLYRWHGDVWIAVVQPIGPMAFSHSLIKAVPMFYA